MEPPDIAVRPEAETDLEAINGIYNPEIEHGVATWDATPWTLDQRRAWFCEHDAMTPALVAEHPGQVIGFAYVTLVSKKHGWRFTREDTIYISPEFRGLKVGERLLGALLDALRELGVRLVIASITSSNEASIRLTPEVWLRGHGRDEERRLQVRRVAEHDLPAGRSRRTGAAQAHLVIFS